ncbi:acyloxyacyl hydrolase [Pseudomonas panipatensis]|uniref:Lipid A deacylase n=1 Tax=Pseudomonas panipatensis TaxID=428992 RepID=A0A1G8MGN3_9PSED|nr:acyloxyacyl hydrolase [Pseudomonas panipatensis]SDI66985.1 lipid A 3-O-deacylase [Pseudomonas panipatensis]SMP77036.1 lipid A 3-O-deacylase [Pseudomonas panipatensis]
MKKLLSLAALAALVWGVAGSAQAVNFSAAVGETSQSDLTLRLGAGFDWDKNWWQSSVGHLTGYWDAGYTYWGAGSRAGGRHSLSFAPVFVYQFNGDSVQPFIEAGIGVAGFTGSEVGDHDLGSAFAFEDRIGVGVKFGGGQALGVRAIHYSNAGMAEPNEGIESYSLFYSLPL